MLFPRCQTPWLCLTVSLSLSLPLLLPLFLSIHLSISVSSPHHLLVFLSLFIYSSKTGQLPGPRQGAHSLSCQDVGQSIQSLVDRSLCSSLKPTGHEWEQDRVGKGGPRAWVRTQNGPGDASESRSGEAEETCNALDMFGRDLSNP